MKNLRTLLLTLVASLSFAAIATTATVASAQTTEHKIGYVDVQEALSSTNQGLALRAQLEQEMASRSAELEQRQAALAAMAAELEAGFELMTPAAQQQKAQEYQTLAMELQTMFQTYQQQIQEREMQGTAGIGERIIAIIATIAEERNYTMVIEKSALLFGLPGDEFTAEVVTRYNALYP